MERNARRVAEVLRGSEAGGPVAGGLVIELVLDV
jgi:hypothetical protein